MQVEEEAEGERPAPAEELSAPAEEEQSTTEEADSPVDPPVDRFHACILFDVFGLPFMLALLYACTCSTCKHACLHA